MRIAFVTFGCFDSHATLKRATGMAAPLLEKGHEVYLLLEDAPINREKAALECPEAEVIWHRSESSAFAERSQKQKTVNEIRPDVVWICGVGLRNWVRKPARHTIMLADHSELYSQVSSSAIRRVIYGLLEIFQCVAFDGHVCASKYLETYYKKRLKKIGKSKRVHYSPYAFHKGVVIRDSAAAESLRHVYENKKIVLYIGTLSENYGVFDMIEAARLLKIKRDDFCFVMIGKGRERERAEGLIAKYGLKAQLRMLGYLEEEVLSGYFSVADVFLCPLRNTIQDIARCPSKIFFYIPYQKPVVTCKVGEASTLFGANGHFFEPQNFESMATVIAQALDCGDSRSMLNPNDHDWSARVGAFLKWYSNSFSV